jgi:hypothetical protein
MKNPVHYTHPHTRAARQALLAFSYSALFFNCSATISSLVLTDEFGELPVRASRKSDPIKQGLFDSSSASLLEVYGARRSWRWVMWHCTSPILHVSQSSQLTVNRVVFTGCWGYMFRYPNFDLRLDRGVTLRSNHGIVRGCIWSSAPSPLHSYGGFSIEQEIERCQDEHYRCRHFFTDSRFDDNGDGIIRC